MQFPASMTGKSMVTKVPLPLAVSFSKSTTPICTDCSICIGVVYICVCPGATSSRNGPSVMLMGGKLNPSTEMLHFSLISQALRPVTLAIVMFMLKVSPGLAVTIAGSTETTFTAWATVPLGKVKPTMSSEKRIRYKIFFFILFTSLSC